MEETKKLLLVEDDFYIRDVFFQVLVEEGYEVTVASDGEDALTCILRKKFDHIITDHWMPKRNGIELIKWCKENKIDSKFIFITAQGNLTPVDKSVLENYQVSFIPKPLTIDLILDEINRPSDKLESIS